MAKQQKPPVVVAELGRPETPAETAYRKATDSYLYKKRKTVNNLVFSLLVSLGLVLVIVLMVPRGVGGFEDVSIDVSQLAEEAAPSAGRVLAAPDVPEGWKAKQAQLRRTGEVTEWRINYTTVDEAFAAVAQGFTADGTPPEDAWAAGHFEQQAETGSEELGGLQWAVYDHSDRSPDSSNALFGLKTEIAGDTVVVYGTDTPGNLRVLAVDVARSLNTPEAP
ncbi:hypothetical protein JOF28_000978 [Leucobacter exalbidus]|uniref:DUF4245 domain-containing protein n=1 Tax=Leucobacter exalbidus TaxID=662960 RepID=A0A940PV13_9MICO|nr:DUF4245 family protein [Leucobacter exalbidus]MBP1325746.1 hypothetical protein [Leucobacter exalbidus]